MRPALLSVCRAILLQKLTYEYEYEYTKPWLLDSSLLCAPSIISQALHAAMVAAEVPLRGKLRAEVTIFSTHPLLLEVVYHAYKHCLYRD